jgi:hypothetical protein
MNHQVACFIRDQLGIVDRGFVFDLVPIPRPTQNPLAGGGLADILSNQCDRRQAYEYMSGLQRKDNPNSTGLLSLRFHFLTVRTRTGASLSVCVGLWPTPTNNGHGVSCSCL